MTEYFLGTARLIIGTIRMPRSKKKRIRNKWIKKQSQVVTDFKVTVNKEELVLKAVKPIACWNFTLDDISEENIKTLFGDNWNKSNLFKGVFQGDNYETV
jgi:hypothetical protein